MSIENGTFLQGSDRTRWVFPDNYLEDMVVKHTRIVRASTDVTKLSVTEPVRLNIVNSYPELNPEQVAKLTSIFLCEVRRKRKSAGGRAGMMPLASHRVTKRGGKRWD